MFRKVIKIIKQLLPKNIKKVMRSFLLMKPGAKKPSKNIMHYKKIGIADINEDIAYLRNMAFEKRSDEIVNNIRSKVVSGGKVKVAFVVNEAAKWNCDSVWDYMIDHPSWDPVVVVSLANYSRKINKLNRSTKYSEEFDFYIKIDPDAIPLYSESEDIQYPIEDLDADIFFFQQPWGMRDFPKRVSGTGLACYMHYGFLMMNAEEKHYNLRSFHPYLWRYFSQSKLHRCVHLITDNLAAKRIVVTGYPKLDYYLDGDKTVNEDRRKRVIFAPHHSLGKKTLNMSTFRWSGEFVFDLARTHPDIDWIYKPHPNLEFTVVKNGVMTKEEYVNYLNSWEELDNCQVLTGGNYLYVFDSSDLLITDCGSFLAEYLPTGRPIIHLKNKGAVEFHKFGEVLSEGFYQAENPEELMEIFRNVFLEGNDSLTERRAELMNLLFPSGKSATFNLIDHLEEQFSIQR